MTPIFIRNLRTTGLDTIHEAFKQAFADYVETFSLSYEQLKYMIERRGYSPDLSFGAFNAYHLVSFTMNGIGNWNEKPTAYDTGTGTIKEFRKRGIATKIFNESLPVLKENGISHYLLEVIRTNVFAIDLYRKAGFKVTREFDYYFSATRDIRIREKKLKPGFSIKKIETPDWDKFKSFWDFDPSWQNSVDSLTRKIEFFTILGIFEDDDLLGYGMIENHSGDIPQLAVRQSHRRLGLGTTLLKKLMEYNKTDEIKIINTVADYEPFKEFARSISINPGHGQYEMILEL